MLYGGFNLLKYLIIAGSAKAIPTLTAANPNALLKRVLSIDEVLGSKVVAYPATSRMCNIVVDGASAIIMTSAEKAEEITDSPIYLEGLGGAVTHFSLMDEPDLTRMAYKRTAEEAYKNAIQLAKETFGTVDILINNAGFQYVAPIEEFPTAVYEKLIKVMLTGSFIGIKHVFPIMKAQKSGRIINMASINGLIGFAGKAAYNSAKHGVIGLTKVAALECARDGITVNALCPGYVDTPLVRGQIADLAKTRNVSLDSALEDVILAMVPQKRLLTVTEIADYAIFLASDKGAAITGQAVVLDGGYTAQ